MPRSKASQRATGPQQRALADKLQGIGPNAPSPPFNTPQLPFQGLEATKNRFCTDPERHRHAEPGENHHQAHTHFAQPASSRQEGQNDDDRREG
jgi:hypothetical protein